MIIEIPEWIIGLLLSCIVYGGLIIYLDYKLIISDINHFALNIRRCKLAVKEAYSKLEAALSDLVAQSKVALHQYLKKTIVWVKLRGNEFALSPWIGAIVAVSAILAGSIASIATEEIRSSIGYYLDENGKRLWSLHKVEFSNEAFIFWSCVVLTLLLFGLNKAAEVKAQDRVIEKQNIGHDRLERAIDRLATLPSDALLLSILVKYRINANAIHLADRIIRALTDEFKTAYDPVDTKAADIRKNYLDKITAEIDETIRKILSILIDLSIIFDESVGGECYGANIMIFSPSSSFEELSIRLEKKLPKILGEPLKLDNSMRGALEGFGCLSASNAQPAKDGVYPIDSELEEIALPVPAIDVSKPLQHGQILPGAPFSFLGASFIGYPSIKDFLTAVDSYYDSSHANSIKAYFSAGSGQRIKSFISVPIPNATLATRSDTDECLGVLNIHSNRPNILLNGESLFWPVIQPFIISIGQLLMRRNDLDNELNHA